MDVEYATLECRGIVPEGRRGCHVDDVTAAVVRASTAGRRGERARRRGRWSRRPATSRRDRNRRTGTWSVDRRPRTRRCRQDPTLAATRAHAAATSAANLTSACTPTTGTPPRSSTVCRRRLASASPSRSTNAMRVAGSANAPSDRPTDAATAPVTSATPALPSDRPRAQRTRFAIRASTAEQCATWPAPSRTNRHVDRDRTARFLRPRHHVILSTTRCHGTPQSSPSRSASTTRTARRRELSRAAPRSRTFDSGRRIGVRAVGRVERRVGADRRKRRSARPAGCARAVVEYYRSIAGEHPDWDEYRAAMRQQGKVLVRMTIERWGPTRTGRLPARARQRLRHLVRTPDVAGDLSAHPRGTLRRNVGWRTRGNRRVCGCSRRSGCRSFRPTVPIVPRRRGALHPPAGQLRRAADHRRVPRPAAAVRRADAAARQRHRRRHRAALPARGLPADRRDAEETHGPAGHCGSSTTSTASRTSTAQTRADVAFGAGWVTARDRMLLLQLGRGPARAAVADVPGIDAFSLVTSGQSFVPSAATEALVTDQIELLDRDLRRQGPADHRRRPGRGRRHQRLLRGERHRHARRPR